MGLLEWRGFHYCGNPRIGTSISGHRKEPTSSCFVLWFERERCRRKQPARRVNSCCDFSFVGKVQLIFAGEYLVREVAQSIVSNGCVLFRAENQPDWRVRIGSLAAFSKRSFKATSYSCIDASIMAD
jgi:hypothetical protein